MPGVDATNSLSSMTGRGRISLFIFALTLIFFTKTIRDDDASSTDPPVTIEIQDKRHSASKVVGDSFKKKSSSRTTAASHRVLLDHFNYCGATRLGDAQDDLKGMDIWYQCRGRNYAAFAEELQAFVDKKYNKRPDEWGYLPRTWGHRVSPVPANATVLFFGNSHTRQQGLALACQMGKDQIEDLHHFEADMIDPNMAIVSLSLLSDVRNATFHSHQHPFLCE